MVGILWFDSVQVGGIFLYGFFDKSSLLHFPLFLFLNFYFLILISFYFQRDFLNFVFWALHWIFKISADFFLLLIFFSSLNLFQLKKFFIFFSGCITSLWMLITVFWSFLLSSLRSCFAGFFSNVWRSSDHIWECHVAIQLLDLKYFFFLNLIIFTR